MAEQPRQLAVVRDYQSLQTALRDRAEQLSVSRESIDHVAGFHAGYTAKLLVGMRRVSHETLGPLLTTLGAVLVLVEDGDALNRFTSRMPRRANAGNDMLALEKRKKRRRYPKLGPEWGRVMRARQLLMQPRELRSQIARKAARTRW